MFRTVLMCGAILTTLTIGTNAEAQDSGSTYDWESGNQYNWNTDALGNTRVRGMNLGTGSTWSQTIEPDGDQRGFDSNHNYWTYDGQTGNYYNFGTGESCFGKGASRVCY